MVFGKIKHSGNVTEKEAILGCLQFNYQWVYLRHGVDLFQAGPWKEGGFLASWMTGKYTYFSQEEMHAIADYLSAFHVFRDSPASSLT
ncbi:hypothetical protein PanWU01x14_095670 [Parasponia andersonii]|uniref:Uncharacterized protein n=1 Tax=Parasponia andersonii TaxID=3476 RepID=A0A2P5D563_PARAD|nr:hypothetical protein PanWU01x14_095670 [Parasponia andersonii]